MTKTQLGPETQSQKVVQQKAYELFSKSPDWVTFYRNILGLHGIVRQHFTNKEALAQFEQTDSYAAIQQMLTKLREQTSIDPPEPPEPTRVITVRLPKSVHEALRVEAHEHCTSMNKLCISKLVQFIDDELVPEE
jgi:predicted HicB family RNase H-like nuclease